MFADWINFLLNISHQLGYGGIVFLMTIESSFIPFPSELVIPPAAYLAAKGQMNLYGVIGAGVVGSLFGAIVNYVLARTLGRTVVYAVAKRHFMRYLLVTQAKIERAEEFFLKYGNIATFIGRLIPVIRQLISLPAGFARMNFSKFLFYTALGSGLWVTFLAVATYLAERVI